MLVTVTVRGRRFPSLAVSVATRFASTMRPTTTAGDLKIRHLTGKHQGVTILGLNRPEVRNAINFAVLEQVQEATQTLPFDGKTRVVILKSEHPGTFCAGADLKERSGQSEDVYRRWSGTIREVFQALASLPVPVLAALDGHALGGGLELALAADLRVAATNAKLGLPETGLAIIPGAGGTQRLPRLVGPSLAKDMIFTGRLLSSEEALRVGLVNYSVDQNQAGDAAFLKSLQIAEEIVEKGPIAVRMAKQAINQGIEVDINSGLELEKAAYSQVIPTEDRIEGLKAFREKRKPLYKGR